DLPTLADGAEALAVGHAHVAEEYLVEMRGAGDLPDWPHLDARRFHVDEKVGEPLVLGGIEVAARHQHAPVAVLRPGGPDLLSVDDPLLAARLRARAQSREVRARAGFGEQLAPNLLPAQRLAGVAVALHLGAPGAQGGDAHAEADLEYAARHDK